MPIDYSSFRRQRLDLDSLRTRQFDLFISGFNDSERIRSLHARIEAARKVWLIHEEYQYSSSELPDGERLYVPSSTTPAEAWFNILRELSERTELSSARVGVDITGMMRPHIIMLPFALRYAGVSQADIYYTDPDAYISGERTTFTKGPVTSVGLLPGMEGTHINRPSPNDVLIVGAGYDHELVKAVVEDKPNAEHLVLLGLPSLQPHMYQESVLKLDRASESIRDYRPASRLYAPANDPFATAQVLADRVSKFTTIDHLYLSPVGAKAQVLGFSWYYWCEAAGGPTSILFPKSERYSRETSRGLAAIHEYHLELTSVRDPRHAEAQKTVAT